MNTVCVFELECSCLCPQAETTPTDLSAAPCPASLCTKMFCDCSPVGHHVSFASWLRHVRRFGPRVGRHDSFASCVRRVRHFGQHVGHLVSFACWLRHVRRFGPRVGRHDSFASCVRRVRCVGPHVGHPDGFASRLRHVRLFTSDWSLTSPRWRNVISFAS